MSRVVLSIGSNLGDRLARLQSVLDRLGGRYKRSRRFTRRPPGVVSNRARSSTRC
jgi:7,8-dihydro-6-hydroxymethylpterin-pyrophosphokinase